MSAQVSGLTLVAYLLTSTIITFFVAGLITITGAYVPFMWFGSIALTVGAALLYTLTPNSSRGCYLGYQILAGIGFGSAAQIPFIAVQVVLNPKDVPVGSQCHLLKRPSPVLIKLSSLNNNLLQLDGWGHFTRRDTKYIYEHANSRTTTTYDGFEPSGYYRYGYRCMEKLHPARPSQWNHFILRRGHPKGFYSPNCSGLRSFRNVYPGKPLTFDIFYLANRLVL